MFGSLVALVLLIYMTVTKNPQYAIAAGLFELSGVLYTAMRPRRLNGGTSNEVSGR